ncbi:MAG: hypothetical protein FJ098_09390, partial [Deltaproteobacteria bacterium]|nr:hypothetical protein [Deltaproteobacteria bacterium]
MTEAQAPGRRARYMRRRAGDHPGGEAPPTDGPPARAEALHRLGEPFTGYLAAAGREEDLAAELGEPRVRHGRLLLAPGPPRAAAWALNVWRDPRRIPFLSVRDAAASLRALQRGWAGYQVHLHRR